MIRKQWVIRFILVALGFIATFTQIYLLREFLSAFYGNELVLGIVLAFWMLFTGFGSWLGRFIKGMKGKTRFIIFLQVLLTLLPLLTVYKLYLWKALVLPPGSMAGLMDILYVSFLLQIPFCLISGFLFTTYSFLLTEYSGKNSAGTAYSAEAIGSVMAGIAVNFILLWITGTIISLYGLLAFSMISTLIFVFFSGNLPEKIILPILFTALFYFLFRMDVQESSEHLLYPNQRVICNRSTPYGNVVVTKSGKQLNFYENGMILFSSHNDIFNEEAVHFALLQHSAPQRVLLISGGISGMISEIMKYHPLRIDYLELNPELVRIGKEFCFALSNPVVRVHAQDARRFVSHTSSKYDAVLVNLPEPSTLQLNRLYTKEFLIALKKILANGAVVSLALPATTDYVSSEAAKLNSSLLTTLKTEFPDVVLIPGQKNYYISSTRKLSLNISELVVTRGISTIYINPYYFDDNLLKDRSGFVMRNLSEKARVNHDLAPILFFYQLNYWSSYFKTNYLLLYGIVFILLLLIFLSLDRISFGMFTAGFTGSSVEILLLISLQVIYGFVYQATGVIIMLFMGGLAVGSGLCRRIYKTPSVNSFIHILLTLSLLTLGLPFIILMLNQSELSDLYTYSVIGLLTLFTAFLTGLGFSLSSLIREREIQITVSKNYSADLFGSATGAFLTSIVLLPLFGIIYTCLLMVILNALSALILSTGRKNFVSL